MSDSIRHECGLALVRLKKSLEWFVENHGTPLYGLFKLFLLMEKQRNRGQDGAGIGAVKFDMPPGQPYMFREREIKNNPIDRIFRSVLKNYQDLVKSNRVYPEFPQTVKEHFDYAAEVYVGHLRYGTSGGYATSACHPFFRRSSWPTRNLMLAGNFNMTNTPELNRSLIRMGQHPIFATDTQAILEKIGFGLDEAHENLYRALKAEGLPGAQISRRIQEEIDVAGVLRDACRDWDGGYAIVGAIGNGDAFLLRDPGAIRPLYYYENDEVFAAASERAPLMTLFGTGTESIREVTPGEAIILRKCGTIQREVLQAPQVRTSCSFERIYFSRGNDASIYQERKALGAQLAPPVLRAIQDDLARTIFSFIPNTAEVAYYGLMDELRRRRRLEVRERILEAVQNGTLTAEVLDPLILDNWPRGEKIAHKDVKLRTFISQEKGRNDLASLVYDVTYGLVSPGDNLVCVDDSIVRGTTLRRSILKILASLRPKRIIIASTAPQIRYPDCYGIDMSELGGFIAFEAAVALLRERGQGDFLREVYQACLVQASKPPGEMENHVRRIYECFTAGEISAKVASLVYPRDVEWQGELRVIFQDIDSLHAALPDHHGDWYFTGNYPTPGGYRVLNRAYINYFENQKGRSY